MLLLALMACAVCFRAGHLVGRTKGQREMLVKWDNATSWWKDHTK